MEHGIVTVDTLFDDAGQDARSQAQIAVEHQSRVPLIAGLHRADGKRLAFADVIPPRDQILVFGAGREPRQQRSVPEPRPVVVLNRQSRSIYKRHDLSGAFSLRAAVRDVPLAQRHARPYDGHLRDVVRQ